MAWSTGVRAWYGGRIMRGAWLAIGLLVVARAVVASTITVNSTADTAADAIRGDMQTLQRAVQCPQDAPPA